MDESREIRTDPRPPLLSIVMPVFREGAQLAGFLSAVRSAAQQCDLRYELLLVDDGSPDDTWRVIEAEVTSGRLLRALRLTRNFDRYGCRRPTPTVSDTEHGSPLAEFWS